MSSSATRDLVTVRAWVADRPGTELRPEPLTLDELRPDEVLVRVAAVGVCHTDISYTDGSRPSPFPVVVGHEGAGVIAAVGTGVSEYAEGDRVVMSFSSCGRCRGCRRGRPSYCASFRHLNSGFGGGPDESARLARPSGERVTIGFFGQSSFADHAVTKVRNLVRLPPDVPLHLAAPLGCGVQTGAGAVLHVLEPAAGSSFVVFGAGGVGLAGLMAAAHLEVATAIAVDPVPGRRELALELGATHALDPRDGDVVAAIHELTGGGAGSAFDTTGIPAVIADAARALGRRGALALVGTGEALATLDVKDLIRSGKSVRGVMEGDADPLRFVPQLIELVQQGRLPIERMIAGYPFAEINRAVADASSGAAIKPVLAF